MADAPEYTGYDPRRSRGERLTIQDILTRFHADAKGSSLNLGSGQRPMEGFINVDYVDMEGVDLVADLFGTDWPIESGSVSLVYMSHFLEHVPDWWQFWDEMWRIMDDGGRVVVYGPWYRSDRYYQDPTHCQPLLTNKFHYLSKDWRTTQKIEHYGPSGNEMNFVIEFDQFEDWHPRFRELAADAKDYHRDHTWNAIMDCCWFLKAIKSEEAATAHLEKLKKSKSQV